MYRLLRRTESDLREIADVPLMNDNKHIFAYVSGLGFGIISGAFALLNVLADAVRSMFFAYRPLQIDKNDRM